MSRDEDVRVLRAAAHPVRLRMLSLLTGAELSAAEVARELDLSHANASYHLRVLLRAGELVVASEEKVRGGVAKRYRHPWDQRLREGPPRPADAAPELRAMAHEVVRRFDRRDQPAPAYLCDAELWVDDETWQRAFDLVQEAGRLVHDNARPPRSAGARRTNLSIAAFGMLP